MTRVLILGYGLLGQAFHRLYHSSYQIRGVKRTPIANESCPIIPLPIQNDALLPHFRWADVVIFSPSSGGGDLTHYEDTYLGNMEFVLRLIQTDRVTIQSLIVIGSTGVYPKSKDGTWKEDTTIPTETPRQEILLRTEQALRSSGLSHVILRCGGMYGNGRRIFSRFIRKGKIQTSEMSDQFISLVHQDDVCRVVDQVITTKQHNTIYNVVDDSRLRKKALFQLISNEAGIPIVETGPAPKTVDRFIVNTRVKEALGYSFHHSFTARFLNDRMDLMR
jgi:nucleoside-diphosphate-sugar epimerase